nr:hypothetical protein [Gordonia sp. LAM0048]
MITLHEDFTGDRFDSRTWIADYLPHWTRPSNSAARWTTSGGTFETVHRRRPTRMAAVGVDDARLEPADRTPRR